MINTKTAIFLAIIVKKKKSTFRGAKKYSILYCHSRSYYPNTSNSSQCVNPYLSHSTNLQVCRIFVALIRSSLELLKDPALQFIGITFEILVAPGVLQEGLTVTAGLLEGGIARQNFITALLDVLRCLQNFDLSRLGLSHPWGVAGSHFDLGLEKNRTSGKKIKRLSLSQCLADTKMEAYFVNGIHTVTVSNLCGVSKSNS